jgi:Phosphoinositide phospholipase C, Ca2+-dependent
VTSSRRLLGIAAATLVAAAACQTAESDPGRPAGPDPEDEVGEAARLRFNQIQVLGSHNSYHVAPEPALAAALHDTLGPEADGFDYTHRPLGDELDAGVRQIELDVYLDDPGGGRYAQPKLVPMLGLAPVDPAMAEPGIKVLHVQEVDYRSTCPTLVACLRDVRDWSDDHPGHFPITIQIEAKDEPIADPGVGFVTPIPWSGPDLAALQDEIATVFDPDRVVTPGDIRGPSISLRAALRRRGWPRLGQMQGQMLFMLDDHGALRDAYRAQFPDLGDRTMFVDVPDTDPDAGIMVVNDPIGDGPEIRRLLRQGYVVRTRADADTVQARSGDTTMRDAALASGAQFVSTDYVFPDDQFGTGYVVDLPGDLPARCNPVTAPPACFAAERAG